MAVDQRSLPAGGQRLLALAAAVPEYEAARHRDARLPWLTRIGTAVRSGWQGAWDILGFIGETIPAELRLMAGKARQGEREIMGNKISPTMIGAFVIGAIVCMVAGVLLFGGGKFFTEKLPYVLFFDSSVEGLHVGAPVIFRGVKVGQVVAIEAIADPKTFTVVIRVQVELVRGSIKVSGGEFTDPHQAIEGLIQQGARASLRMQSFVTGVLYVAVDFHPDTPIKRLGLDPRYPELPTIPSDIDMLKSTVQQVMADLGKLPLEAVLNEVLVLLKQTNSLVALPEVKQALVSLQDVVTAAERLLQHADTQVSALGPRLAGAADTARAALVEAQKLLRDVDGQVTPLAGSAQDTLTAARGTLGQAHKSLVKLTDAASPALKQAEQTLGGADGMIHQDLAHTLKALEEAAKSIRALAETLQRHPESLLRGR